ncbi:eukaryotic translation initiation factor 2B gamma [Haematococcus lacustris]
MRAGLAYQAILLAGGDDKRLHPLTSGMLKALLPVANRPLISYALKSLADAGLKHTFVVVSGERPAASIQAWVQQEYSGPDKMQCEVICVAEDYGTADALRACASKVTAKTCVVLSGDLLTDLPVNALVASHQMNQALATVLLYPRKVSPVTETKPGKAPKNVDYIGLDPSRQHLLFYASSPDTLRDLKLPLSAVRRHGSMSIASDLADAHLYVLDRSVLDLLHSRPELSSLRQDLLPCLTQQQPQLRPTNPGEGLDGSGQQGLGATSERGAGAEGPASETDNDNNSESRLALTPSLPGADFMQHSHVALRQQGQLHSTLRVHIVQPGVNYCARVADPSSYADVNREVADPNMALHLSGLRPSKLHDNVVPASTVLGNKTTIAAGCVLGEGCTLGDKASIKRSVLGANCRLGANVKVINSVLQDGVVIGDGVTLQNTVCCQGASVKERTSLKDCQVGMGFTVPAGQELKGEVLVKAKPS